MSKHHAKFTWGAGPNSVHVAGSFNNWSGDATPLQKLPDGSFGADVPLPWGEKQAYKYVVDGEWKIREDEAKEWDAAGNMNNVYTAPHAPSSGESTGAATSTSTAAATSVPSTSTKDTPAPTTKSETTVPSNLLASSAPGAASAGGPPVLGAAAFATKPTSTTTTTSTAQPVVPAAAEPITATAAVPIEDAPVKTDSTAVQIEKTAANANIGEAPTGEQQTLQERAAEVGATALSSLGAIYGGAVAAVEKATGYDLSHSDPLTVEEAKAQGIDVNTLAKKDAETDTVSPAGTAPSAAAVADLEEKTQQLRETTNAATVTSSSVPLPNGEAPKSSYANAPEPIDTTTKRDELDHDLPAQHETTDNHQTVPQPIISSISEKDPRKDRSANAPVNADTAGTKPISTDPAVSAKEAKEQAEAHPGRNGSTTGAAEGVTASKGPGEAVADPTAKSTNTGVKSPPTPPKDASAPASSTAATTQPTPVAPSTPAKQGTTPATVATPASGVSTAASTPAAKAGHKKEETSGSDVRKRKSSIFGKIKHAFSPKDKEKK